MQYRAYHKGRIGILFPNSVWERAATMLSRPHDEVPAFVPSLSRLSVRPDADLLRRDRLVADLQLARIDERQNLHRAAGAGRALVHSQRRAHSRHARPPAHAAALFHARNCHWFDNDHDHRHHHGVSIQSSSDRCNDLSARRNRAAWVTALDLSLTRESESGERTRLACWFRRLAETIFRNKLRWRGRHRQHARARALPRIPGTR